MAPDLTDQIAAAARSSLEKLAAEQGGLRSELRCGDPAAEILRAIDELKPELVVMGTHGRRGLARLLLGSVAEKVVRSSPVPVLTVPARAH
jgi:nucleotide-binding universal stress UspA family protein